MPNHEIKKWIIEKLLRHHVLCKYHIDEDDLPKGKHPKYRNLVKEELREMTRDGLIVRFPHLGKHKICLNREKAKLFKDVIESINI